MRLSKAPPLRHPLATCEEVPNRRYPQLIGNHLPQRCRLDQVQPQSDRASATRRRFGEPTESNPRRQTFLKNCPSCLRLLTVCITRRAGPCKTYFTTKPTVNAKAPMLRGPLGPVGFAVGQWAGRPTHCHYRTPRDGFPITGLLNVWGLVIGTVHRVSDRDSGRGANPGLCTGCSAGFHPSGVFPSVPLS